MAAPEHVPEVGAERPRYYESPPRRPRPWEADRPGELTDGQPEAFGVGVQGPDQGYALRLIDRFQDRIVLTDGERRSDVVAGAVHVAMKRAALFGRAPVKDDVEIALRLFGFLDAKNDPELVDLRRQLFEGVANSHHYQELRELVASVPEESLRRPTDDVAGLHRHDWRTLLLPGLVVPPP